MFRIKFNKIPQHFRRRIREALVQSQVRFNRNPEKIPGRLDARPSQPQQDSNDNSGEVSKLEIKELHNDFKDPQENLKDLEPRAVSLCFKHLSQPDSKTGRPSKEITNKSMASQEIARLTQKKQALEVKLKNLEEKHKAKLFQISQMHPNLVSISSDLRGNTL